MNERSVLDLIEAGGITYEEARPLIVPGDLLFLHHAYVKDWMELSLYDKQIYAVQKFTGPMAHIGILDRALFPDEPDERVICYESVTDRVRAVRLSTTAEHGFFWVRMDKPITPAEREALWAISGFGPYSKVGAVLAGLGLLPKDEAQRERMWCAKLAEVYRAKSGVDLGGSMVPTQQLHYLMDRYNARLQYVRMN